MKLTSFLLLFLLMASGEVRGEDVDFVSDLKKNFTYAGIETDYTTKCIQEFKGIQNPQGLQYLSAEAALITEQLSTCNTYGNNAQGACLESVSPHLATATAILGGLASTVAQMKSASDICKQNGSVLDLAKNAMGLYNGACGGLKLTCDIKCKNVKKVIAEATKKAEVKCAGLPPALPNPPADGLTKENCMKEMNEVFAKFTKAATESGNCFVAGCGNYQHQLIAATGAMGQMLLQSQAAKKCEKQVNATPTAVAETSLDCTKPENDQNSTCICQKNPRQAGCPGALALDREQSRPIGLSSDATGGALSGLNGITGLPTADLGDGSSGSGADTGAGGGGGSASGVGSSAGLGKTAASAKGADDKGAGKAAINTDINGGESAGGGGGSRTAGPGYNDKFAKFAPTKEQARKMASGSTPEITGKSGKSNWEKVNERYSENRTRLISK